MQKGKSKAETNSLRGMMSMMTMNDDAIERMREPSSAKVKDQSGFALLVATFLMVDVSLAILSFALMS